MRAGETFPLDWASLEGERVCLKYIRAAAAKSLQSCPTLCDPIDCSPPGSPVPGILQARMLSANQVLLKKFLAPF